MNKNLYKFYVEAKSKGKGYQERMKGMWDEKYPVLNNVTPKDLASQVRNMLKKNASILLTTQTESTRSEQQEQQCVQENANQENTDHERGNLEMNRQRTEQNSERQIQIEEPNLDQYNIPQNEGLTNVQANREEDQVYLQKKAELKETFIKNYNKYKEMNINYREYSTKATPPPEQNNIKILNEISSEEFSEQEHSLDQWTLNVSAVTILEQENRLREINGRTKRSVKPG